MTISVAVTGGIGAGKSTVSGLLVARGAVLVDSDRLAREVVGVGTPGLAAVSGRFGSGVLAPDGSLDRAALAAIVFSDPAARKELEAITHPLVRARAAALLVAAPQGSVVVNDIPLLTSMAVASAFHLVIGVGAPEAVRVRRLVERGLTAQDATARIRAQIDDRTRRPLCDTWVDNSTSPADVLKRADLLWSRLSEFAANVEAQRPAARGRPALVPYNPEWPAVAARLMARAGHAIGPSRIDHVGPTAVPGLAAQGVIDLQLTVADLAEADSFAPALADAGFPRSVATADDMRNLHVNADPGQSVNLYLRVRDQPDWRRSLRLRDWLCADEGARADYAAAQLAAQSAAHPGDRTIGPDAAAQEGFLAEADARGQAWAEATGWEPG